MAPVIVQSKTGVNNTGNATVTVTWDTPATAGNLLIITSGSDDYRRTNVTGTPTGFTLSTGMSQETFLGHYLFWKVASGGETSATFSIGSAAPWCWVSMEVSGLTGTPYDVSNGQFTQSSATSYTTPSITPAAGSKFLVASIGGSLSSAFSGLDTWTNSFTEVADSFTTLASGTRDIVGLATLVVTANGSTAYSSGASYSGGTSPQSRTGLIIAFTVASGGTTQNADASLAETAGLTATGAATKPASGTLSATLAASSTAQAVKGTGANSSVSAGLSAGAATTKSVSANLGLTANLSADAANGAGSKAIAGTLVETATATANSLVNKGSGSTVVTATGLAATATTVKGSGATQTVTAGLSAAASVTKSVSGSLAETASLSSDATVGIAPQQIAGTLTVAETASAQASLVKPATVLAATTANLSATASVVKSVSGSIAVNTALTATEARTFSISATPLQVTFNETAVGFLQGPVVGGTATNLERSTYEAISNAGATATATAYVPSAPSAEGR